MRQLAGFTLIELVIVMLVITVGLLGLTPLFSNTSKSLTINEDLQRAAEYAQQCAEQVLAARRNSTYAAFAVPGAVCNPADANGFHRTASAGTDYYGTTNPACPGTTTKCKDITIRVTKGDIFSSITVMLVDY